MDAGQRRGKSRSRSRGSVVVHYLTPRGEYGHDFRDRRI
ncbi:hypothetical protein BofuT4_P083250.1 [Botrytis cinerea T4]|uniref:Uncharacterized protein n=1 Tax=Botryotinia fuckeliana (strain T4) TaxID=999810 RepID=G2YJX4_BOTF4|nr:hypothetical protein BofuT4_P083250.1 [Botrytis cinerea T4]